MATFEEAIDVAAIGDDATAAAAAPSVSALERAYARYLIARGVERAARADLREAMARHQATASRAEIR